MTINLSTKLSYGLITTINGGTGLSTPGASGNVLTSNGTSWVSSVISVSSISATGSRDATTYLAGDNTWKSIKESTYTPTVSGSGSVSISIDFSTVNSTTIIINLPAGINGATITFTNLATPATSGTIFSFSVIVSHVAALSSDTAVVFRHGASLLPKWTGNIVPPSTTTAAAIDIWSFFTYDAGASLVGSLAMADVRNA